MPNVNLIATRRAEKKRVERNTRRLFLGLTTEVAALVALGSMLGVQQMRLQGELSDATTKLLQLQPTLDRIKAIEKDTAVLKPKLDTLVSAKADTLRWRAMLQIVSQSVPSNAWLSAISATGTGDETMITIAGVAGSQTLVGETMTRLQSFPVFGKVDLRFTQLASQPDDPVQRITFEIGAQLKSSSPEVQAGAPGATGAAANTEQKKAEGNKDEKTSA